jgi:Icc-related predicted phosphoesterase
VRLLLVSDLHYSLRQCDWVVAVASSYDLVVLAGDHLDVASTMPLDGQIVAMSAYFERLHASARLVVSSGNHDLDGPDADGEQAAGWLAQLAEQGIATDGTSLTVGDTLVTVCPWWDGPVGRDRVAAQLAADGQRRPRRWVWVYHWPPDGSRTAWTGRRHYGDADVLGWIENLQPDVVLAGHVHESAFKPDGSWADRIGATWVFNAGRQIGPEPAHVVVDLDERWADWHSMLGVESVSLDAPPPAERTVV